MGIHKLIAVLSAVAVVWSAGGACAQDKEMPAFKENPAFKAEMKAQWGSECSAEECLMYRKAPVAPDVARPEAIAGDFVTIVLSISRRLGSVSMMAFEVPRGRDGEGVALTFYDRPIDGAAKRKETIALPYDQCTPEVCVTGIAYGNANGAISKREVDVLELLQTSDLLVFNFRRGDKPFAATAPTLGFKEAYEDLLAHMAGGPK